MQPKSTPSDLMQVVMKNDKLIYDLASYYESKGNTMPVISENCYKRFTEFKMRILKGSVTLEALEKMVFGKFGVLEGSPYVNCKMESIPKDIQDLVKALEIEEIEE